MKIVVSSRWMIYKEEWVFNIFIQCRYPVLTDTYKKKQNNKLQTINKRIHKILRRVKSCIAKRIKISSNINQVIKSTDICCTPHRTG